MRPREYLSYTQKSLWKKSPAQYKEKYLFEGAKFVTKEMAFGKRMAVALEDDEASGDPLLDLMIAQIPKFEKMEYPVSAELIIANDRVPLYGQIDTCKIDLSGFKEYKTGKNGWTQRRVDEDEQITFYATMIYILTKKIPNDIELVWVETKDGYEVGEIVCTGRIERFRTKRSMGQVINEMADMKRVWREIGEMCEKELL
jgi:hypothetical protein